ncbi:MAG: hypothetical protein ABIO94_03315, partial [Opitutaceae bacterium]
MEAAVVLRDRLKFQGLTQQPLRTKGRVPLLQNDVPDKLVGGVPSGFAGHLTRNPNPWHLSRPTQYTQSRIVQFRCAHRVEPGSAAGVDSAKSTPRVRGDPVSTFISFNVIMNTNTVASVPPSPSHDEIAAR